MINKLGEHMAVRLLGVYICTTICIHFVYRLTTQCPSSRIKPLYTNYNIDISNANGSSKGPKGRIKLDCVVVIPTSWEDSCGF